MAKAFLAGKKGLGEILLVTKQHFSTVLQMRSYRVNVGEIL